jgi:hypothetical protein
MSTIKNIGIVIAETKPNVAQYPWVTIRYFRNSNATDIR